MIPNFDEIIDRRSTDSMKWAAFGDDILPMWVADMDFRSPEPILKALHARIDQGTFGYGKGASDELLEVLCQRYAERHGWQIEPDWIVFFPNLFNALFILSKTIAEPDDGHVLVQTPVYGPFLIAPEHAGRPLDVAQLAETREGQIIRYEIDYHVFAGAIQPATRLFILCNPHNPVGRVYDRAELERLAEICLQHENLIICSDEVHADLRYDGLPFTSLASISPEIAQRTITISSASKAFNLPGLKLGFAIIPDEDLRERIKAAQWQQSVGTNILGYVATLAAYRDAQPWLDALVEYLQGNRDYVVDYVKTHLPQINITQPEGTYLAWLDCRALGHEKPADFFMEQAKVAVNEGAWFGEGGEGFVRLNFGCPRSQLTQALEQMKAAIEA